MATVTINSSSPPTTTSTSSLISSLIQPPNQSQFHQKSINSINSNSKLLNARRLLERRKGRAKIGRDDRAGGFDEGEGESEDGLDDDAAGQKKRKFDSFDEKGKGKSRAQPGTNLNLDIDYWETSSKNGKELEIVLDRLVRNEEEKERKLREEATLSLSHLSSHLSALTSNNTATTTPSTSTSTPATTTSTGILPTLHSQLTSLQSQNYSTLQDSYVDLDEGVVSPLASGGGNGNGKGGGVGSGNDKDNDDGDGNGSGPMGGLLAIGKWLKGGKEGTMVERLEDLENKLSGLKKVRSWMEVIDIAEKMSISSLSTALTDPTKSQSSYLSLLSLLNAFPPSPSSSSSLHLHSHLHHLTTQTLSRLKSLLGQQLLDVLESKELEWPKSGEEVGWKRKLIVGWDWNKEGGVEQRLKEAWEELAGLERMYLSNPIPPLHSYSQGHQESGQSVEESSFPSSSEFVEPLLPIQIMARPLILRFRYYFDGKKGEIDRLDKPERPFSHILNAITEQERFMTNEIQDLVEMTGFGARDALSDLITLLLLPLRSKLLRSTIPQLLSHPTPVPWLLAHTISQTLQFDEMVRERWDYEGPAVKRKGRGAVDEGEKKRKWKGLAEEILGRREWFEKWVEGESKFVDDRYYEIISSSEAWKLSDQDFANDEDEEDILTPGLRSTNSAMRVRDLMDQVVERYRPLPSMKYRLPFLLHVHLPLLRSYYSRLLSSLEAFESLSFGLISLGGLTSSSVGGSGAGTNYTVTTDDDGSGGVVMMPGGGDSGRGMASGVEGLGKLVRMGWSSGRWIRDRLGSDVEEVWCLEVSEAVLSFGHAHHHSRNEGNDLGIENPMWKEELEELVSEIKKGGGGNGFESVFGPMIERFDALERRTEELVVKHVVREIMSEVKPWIGKRWDTRRDPDSTDSPTSPTSPNSEDEDILPPLTPDLIPTLTQFSTLLSTLISNLPPTIYLPLVKKISMELANNIWNRVISVRTFSEKGGRGFLVDVEDGWIEAVRDAMEGSGGGSENRNRNRGRKGREGRGWERVREAARLLALPASTSSSTSSASISPSSSKLLNWLAPSAATSSEASTSPIKFSTVMQAAWDEDDVNEVKLKKVLERIGIYELKREEVKAVLKRRPECWLA